MPFKTSERLLRNGILSNKYKAPSVLIHGIKSFYSSRVKSRKLKSLVTWMLPREDLTPLCKPLYARTRLAGETKLDDYWSFPRTPVFIMQVSTFREYQDYWH